MIDWSKRLDKITESKTDKKFLLGLAKWVLYMSGNVNAAQRLNVLSDRIMRDSDLR